MINLTQANNALKDVYLDVIANQINCNTDVLLGKIKQTSSDVWGKEIIKNVWINGKMLTLKEELKNFYVSLEISDKAIRCSQNSAVAFLNLLNDEVEHMVKEAQHRLRNSFYTEDTKPDYLPEDFKYQPMEITGLKKIFDTKSKTLYGLSRKENPEMNPVIKTIDKFDPIKIQEIIDNNNDEVNVIVCSAKIKRDYMQYMSEHRQNIEVIECDGGFKCLQFNNSLLMVQAKIPDNEIYLLNTEDFKLHQLCDWEWLESESGSILIPSATTPTYSATLVKYADYICEKPYKQIKIILGENKWLARNDWKS